MQFILKKSRARSSHFLKTFPQCHTNNHSVTIFIAVIYYFISQVEENEYISGQEESHLHNSCYIIRDPMWTSLLTIIFYGVEDHEHAIAIEKIKVITC